MAFVSTRGFLIFKDYIDIGIEDLVKLPQRATERSAGYDIHAASSGVVMPGKRLTVDTGITVYMQPDEEFQIRPRSGLAAKHGVTVLNSPGTVDADFEGKEIKVILFNTSDEPFHFQYGDRIAQGVFSKYLITDLDLPGKQERTDGFGHTGR